MANYCVGLWFAILSVSPAICHEHADGEADHSHGYGLFALSPRLASTCGPESELAPHSRHYHLVVFGIELTILPGCAALEAGILPGHGEATVSLTAYSACLAVEQAQFQQTADSLAADNVLVIAAHHSQTCGSPADLPSARPIPTQALRSGIQII